MNNFLKLRPNFLFTNLKSTQRKKGSNARSEKRMETLHNEIIKNLGATKKASEENQRLL